MCSKTSSTEFSLPAIYTAVSRLLGSFCSWLVCWLFLRWAYEKIPKQRQRGGRQQRGISLECPKLPQPARSEQLVFSHSPLRFLYFLSGKASYSIDENLYHTSYESGILEDPMMPPPPEMFKMTVDPLKVNTWC